MKRVRVIATQPQTYGTRRLTAGDEFDVTQVEAAVMIWKKKARFAPSVRARLAPEPAPVPAMATVPEPAADDPPSPVSHETAPAPEPAEHRNSIDDLREEAEALGVAVDGRWGVVRLQTEIARAKRR